MNFVCMTHVPCEVRLTPTLSMQAQDEMFRRD
jgi:hypothetical protein